MIKLSQRLQAIAQFVPQGAQVADIGTDHGFLPCYLVQCGQADRVIACDINEQPLAVAQKNIADTTTAIIGALAAGVFSCTPEPSPSKSGFGENDASGDGVSIASGVFSAFSGFFPEPFCFLL